MCLSIYNILCIITRLSDQLLFFYSLWESLIMCGEIKCVLSLAFK